jgi:hypothetical protein
MIQYSIQQDQSVMLYKFQLYRVVVLVVGMDSGIRFSLHISIRGLYHVRVRSYKTALIGCKLPIECFRIQKNFLRFHRSNQQGQLYTLLLMLGEVEVC